MYSTHVWVQALFHIQWSAEVSNIFDTEYYMKTSVGKVFLKKKNLNHVKKKTILISIVPVFKGNS